MHTTSVHRTTKSSSQYKKQMPVTKRREDHQFGQEIPARILRVALFLMFGLPLMCVYIHIYTSIYLVLSCLASEATNTSYHSRREHLTRSFQSEGTQVQVSKSLRSLQQKLMKICRRGYRGSVRNHEFT